MGNKRIKILAIDDNHDNLVVIKALLAEAFPLAVLFAAQTGELGIELCHKHKPDVVLLDIVMPIMDGYQVCEILKNNESLKSTPIVMVTAARTDREGRIKALEAGADGFLTKPLDESELKAQVRAMLRIKESEDRKLDEKERLERLVAERTEALETELAERIKAEKEIQVSYSNLEKRKKEVLNLMKDLESEIVERKRIEKLQSDTNKKYAEAQRIAHIGNWEHNMLTGELQCSEEMYHILGISLGTPLVMEEVIKCYPPEELVRFALAIKEAFEENKQYSIDYKIIRPSGQVRYIHNEGKPIRDENGKPLWMIGTSHDITERKLVENALKESEEHFQMLFDNAPVGYQSLDVNGLFVEVNETWLELLGYAKNEVIGKWFGSFLAPEFVDHFKERFPHFKEWGKVHSEFEMIKKDGNRIVVAFDGRIGHTLSGEFKQTHCVINDITELRRAELIQKVLYAISHAVITTKDIEEFSEVIKEQLGQLIDTTNFRIVSYDELTGMLTCQYFMDQKDPIASWPAEKSLTGYVIKNDKSIIITKKEISELNKAGEIVMIGTACEIWLGVPLHEGGKVIGAFVLQNYDDVNAYTAKDLELLEFISHQISISFQRKKGLQDLVEALAKAEESDNLKTAFLSNMSHEIRTPMNGILGFSELLDDDLLSREDRRKFLDIINTNGQHLLSIINDILDIARIDSNQLVINETSFDLHLLLDELLISYENSKITIGKEHLTFLLEKEFDIDSFTITCDEVRLRQILYNLLGNALKFTKTGFVKFGYKQVDDKLQFYIQDTGKGISKENQLMIFERFRQEEESYTRQFGGTGLGLSISKKLVELLGGEMWMVSDLGVGTTFYFTIPNAILSLKSDKGLSNMAGFNLYGKTILIVDDVEDNAALFNFYLENTHARMLFAKNGQEAVDICRSDSDIHLVLMDIQMPVLNGIDATSEIRKFNKQLPIIAVTAYAFPGDRQCCIDAGCNDFLTKPIDSDELFRTVKTFIS